VLHILRVPYALGSRTHTARAHLPASRQIRGKHATGFPGNSLFYVPEDALVGDGLICYSRTRAYRIDLGPQGIALQMGVISRSHETLIYAKSRTS
jgi:hypothetical protein